MLGHKRSFPQNQALASSGPLARSVHINNEGKAAEVIATIHEWLSDLRLGLRTLWHTPRFSVPVILTLALVIGANTAIFSFVNILLFRPLPVREPAQIVRLDARSSLPGMPSPFPWSYPQFEDYRDVTGSAFSGMSLFAPQGFVLRHDGRLANIPSAVVSGDFFQVMGLGAQLGRTLAPGDDSVTSPADNVVLSESFWRTEFGASPKVVGQHIELNKRLFTVVGVVRGGSVFAALGSPRIFVPVHAATEIMGGNSLNDRGAGWIQGVYARLKPGATLAGVQTALDFEASRLARQYPGNDGKLGFAVTALKTGTLAGLLRADPVATVRVAQLLWLAVALRLFGDSLPLCVIGGATGVLLGLVGLKFAGHFPAMHGMQPVFDWWVAVYAAALTLGSALLFSLVPLAAVMRKNLNHALAASGATATPGRRQQRQHRMLSIGQIALSMMLLAAMGLILHTLIALNHVDLGFDPDRVVIAGMDFTNASGAGFKAPPVARLQEVRDKIMGLPEVSAVAFGDQTPLDGIAMNYNISVPGFATPAGAQPSADVATISAGYLQALGARLLAGQDFEEIPADQQDAVLVNETMAKQFWQGENSVGRGFTANKQTLRVAGVIADIRNASPAEAPGPFFYYRYPVQAGAWVEMVVRTRVPVSAAFRRTLATTLQGALPDLPAPTIETMSERLRGLLSPRTNMLWALSVFGLLALLITAVGVFSVVHYNVTLRYREFAMRMALGATPRKLRRLVLWQVVRFSAIGIAIGVGLSVVAGRLLKHYVFGVGVFDPASLLPVIGVLVIAVLLAGAIPAWTASRLEPSEVLRDL